MRSLQDHLRLTISLHPAELTSISRLGYCSSLCLRDSTSMFSLSSVESPSLLPDHRCRKAGPVSCFHHLLCPYPDVAFLYSPQHIPPSQCMSLPMSSCLPTPQAIIGKGTDLTSAAPAHTKSSLMRRLGNQQLKKLFKINSYIVTEPASDLGGTRSPHNGEAFVFIFRRSRKRPPGMKTIPSLGPCAHGKMTPQ